MDNNGHQYSSSSRYYRLGMTVAIMALSFCKGTTVGLAGVTFIDMKIRLNTSYDHLSHVIMCRHAASLFGTALGGFVSNRLRTRLDLCLTISTLGMAISFLGISIVKNIYAISAFYALSGLCSGAAYVVVSVCLLLLWEKTATLFNLKHAVYVFGTMIIILLTRQFLTRPEKSEITEDHPLPTRNNLTSHQQLNPAVSAFIYWPFFIGFGFKFFTFIFFSILYIIPTPSEIEEKLTKSRNQTKDVGTGNDSDKNEDKSETNNYFLVLGLLLSSAFFNGACQTSFVQYTFSTAVELNNGFNQKDAALLSIVLFGVSCLSVLLEGVAAFYIPIRTLTLTVAFIAILPDILLTFVGTESSKMFWIFAVMKALLINLNAPLLVPFIDSYIEIAGGLMAIYKTMCFTGSIIQYFINGYLLEYESSWTLLLFGLILTMFLFIAQFAAFLAARTNCKLKSWDKSEEERLLEE